MCKKAQGRIITGVIKKRLYQHYYNELTFPNLTILQWKNKNYTYLSIHTILNSEQTFSTFNSFITETCIIGITNKIEITIARDSVNKLC